MNSSSLTVRMRLTMGFGVVCALMLVILGVGLLSMNRIHDGVTTLVDDRIPKMEAARTILAEADSIAIALRDTMLTADAADRKKLNESIAQSRSVIGKNVELLDQLIAHPKGKELLQKVKDQRTKFIAGQDALLALISADKADEAKAYLASELRPILGNYKGAISALLGFQTELLDETAKAGGDAFSQARAVMLGLGVLALLAAAGIGFWITRSLLKELGGEPSDAADLARAVSQGDFTRTVALRNGAGQIGCITGLAAQLLE